MQDLVLHPVRGLTDPQDVVPLLPEGTVTIGRAGTLKVHDELVSIHHAQIFLDDAIGKYVLRDLDSSSGTMVDGECIRNDTRPIRAGTELRFGNAVVRVERRRSSPRWVLWAFLSLVLCVLLVTCMSFVLRETQDDTIRLRTGGKKVWGLPGGPVTEVEVPPHWLRRHGLPWNLSIDDITDHDANDVSELWLNVADDRVAVVTFDEAGNWVDLGMLPGSFRRPQQIAGGFPVLDAAGETWEMDAETGRYRPVKQDGVVVWYREEKAAPASEGKEGKAPESKTTLLGFDTTSKPLKVARVPIKDSERLGQFFVDRGIYGKVHYLICEGAFPGIRAQVLTSSGRVDVPHPSCIEELRFDANPGSKIDGKPYAIALSPAGRRALVDDVLNFYGGEPGDLFLDKAALEKIGGLRDEPGPQNAATRLLAGDGRVVVSDPFPSGPTRLAAEPRVLESADPRLSPAAKPARSVVVEGPGELEFGLDGRRFRVVVDDQVEHLEVEEISTGVPRKVISVSLATAGGTAPIDDLEVRVAVEHYRPIGEARIQRIRVGARPR